MLPRKGGRAGWDRAQPPDVASGFEDGDDAKSLLGLGGKGYLYSYVPYCRLAFGFFQSKRPSRIGFGGADLGVLGRLECRFFMLAWGAMFHPQKTSQLAAAMVRLCRAECTLTRRRGSETWVMPEVRRRGGSTWPNGGQPEWDRMKGEECIGTRGFLREMSGVWRWQDVSRPVRVVWESGRVN